MPKDLSANQKAIMDLICLGKTEAEVGLILGKAASTVHTSMFWIRRKLDASNKTLAVAKYLKPELFKKG